MSEKTYRHQCPVCDGAGEDWLGSECSECDGSGKLSDTELLQLQYELPSQPDADTSHDYLSNDCHHRSHSDCEVNCFYCSEPCTCECHEEKE